MLTAPSGEYLGGIVRNEAESSGVLSQIQSVLLTHVLPKLKEKGWLGVGGVDVLIDAEDNFFL